MTTIYDPLKAYLKLQAKLKSAVTEDEDSKQTKRDYDVEEAASLSSSKHHYIPQYFINGFLAADKQMDVYDKQRGAIQKHRKSTGGVFYELGRNSADFGFSRPVSLFEDAYGTIDNLLPAAVKLLRADPKLITRDIFLELMAHINILIIDLFWRNINSDQLFEDIYSNYKITFTLDKTKVLSKEHTEYLKTIPGFKQLSRLSLIQSALRDALEMEAQEITTGNLIAFETDQICIGDMPFLFLFQPYDHYSLNRVPAIIPISKSKIYLRNVERIRSFDSSDTCMINALIIKQSSKMICGANPTVLKSAIECYDFACKNNCFDEYWGKLFYD